MPRILAILLAAGALSGCTTMPPLPAEPAEPAVYRALGTEPGWTLTIGAKMMRFSGPYGRGAVSEPTPRAIHGFAGDIYQGKRIRVNIVHGRCGDGMSDRAYADSVQVGVDGKSFIGCGGM